MRRELFDVEDSDAVASEDRRHREEREVREVLVVDGVELVVLHQLEQVRELHGDDAVGGEQHRHSRDEVVEIGHVGQHVVAEEEVGADALATRLAGQLGAEELDACRDAAFNRRRRDVRGRLDPEHGDAALDEVLEQVAVVARDLDDLAVGAEAEPLRHIADVGTGVLEPAPRERREVRVVAEDVLRRLEFGQLHEEAVARRRRRAAGRTVRLDRAGQAPGRSWRAATCRGRRTTRAARAPQNRQGVAVTPARPSTAQHPRPRGLRDGSCPGGCPCRARTRCVRMPLSCPAAEMRSMRLTFEHRVVAVDEVEDLGGGDEEPAVDPPDALPVASPRSGPRRRRSRCSRTDRAVAPR